MDSNELLLSICIPTNGAVQWILPVLDSIYQQDADRNKFEIIVTDNGKDSELEKYLGKYVDKNFHYYRTNDEGFLNLVTSLQKGNGLFCKMLNHRSVLVPGAIQRWLDLINKYKEEQPIIYCSDGNLALPKETLCQNLDEFVSKMTYWLSWSGGIGFWKQDVDKIKDIILDEMFPNASIILNIRNESKYLIWNEKFQNMLDDSGKGGYDLFETFAIVFLDLFNDLRIHKRIKKKTFIQLKESLFSNICGLYYTEVFHKSKHTFIIQDVKDNIMYYYGYPQFLLIKLDCIRREILRPYHKFKYFFSRM